jgi:multiple sugar transport system substrate-binding protein
MQVRAVLLAAVLVLAPLGARGADLVVWWDEGYYAEEDEAIREIIAAFEQKTGKQVELVFHPMAEQSKIVQAAIDAGSPPDFLFGVWVQPRIEQWAFEGRLEDLTDAIQPFVDLFDADVLEYSRLLDNSSGRWSLYALPMGRSTLHVHVWKNLLERAGFTLADIPREWEAFWSFWCDRVQPAVRRALGRDDVWGVGLPMSPVATSETRFVFMEFVHAVGADYLTHDGQLVIDRPSVRAGLVAALDGYTAIWRKGCTPPDAVTWDGGSNNDAFLVSKVVMTANQTLSIPNALRASRPDDYNNVATVEWPSGLDGGQLTIEGDVVRGVVFKHGRHVTLAKEFVRFLVENGWLAHWLTFAGDRFLPPMRKLVEQPFWLDPSDPHRMRSAVQALAQPHAYLYSAISGNWRHGRVTDEGIWPKAVHRVAGEGISPEEAVDEAIARVKQILSE